ncbi:tetratricopeptide repeat protein [Jiella sp. M17.18]|uniref:tetratricopeptide repeat protein n=1 Tax=Jiella sp. M17.18 TaxID=3234247 RepID=UPI0034DE9D47
MPLSRVLRTLTTTVFVAAAATSSAFAAGEAPDVKVSTPNVQAQSLAGAYLAAKAAQQQGDLPSATDFFNQALALDPTSQLLQQDAMFAFLADGNFQEGVDLAAKLHDDADASKVARITLGVDALRKGDFQAAITEFAIPDPSDLDGLLLGHLSSWAELGAGHVDKALMDVDGLKHAPWYTVFNAYQKGLLASVAGRTDVARAAFQSVLDDQTLARTSPDAYLGSAESLARVEARAGQKDAALKALDFGLKLAPNYAPLTYLRDRIQRGETIEPPVANIQQGAAETLYVLGQAINRGDGQQVALLYFQLARALDPRSPALLTALAGIAEQAQQLDLAISYYKEIPENSAYRRTADLQTGLDLWYSGKKDEAKTHLQRAVRDYPDDVQAYTALADVMSADKNYQKAADALNKAIELAPKGETSNWNLYYQRGIAYERMKQWDKAEPDFKKALQLSPNQPQVLNYLGYSWIDMNIHLKQGLDMIKTAVELRPNDGYIIDSLGWAYYKLGRYDDAVDELERAVLLTPLDPTINDHLGDAYWRVGRKREAKFQWNRALNGDPKPEPDEVKSLQAKLENGLQAAPAKGDHGQSGDASDAGKPAGGAAAGAEAAKAQGAGAKAD